MDNIQEDIAMMIPSILFCLAFVIAFIMMALDKSLRASARVFYLVLFADGAFLNGVLVYMLYNIPK